MGGFSKDGEQMTPLNGPRLAPADCGRHPCSNAPGGPGGIDNPKIRGSTPNFGGKTPFLGGLPPFLGVNPWIWGGQPLEPMVPEKNRATKTHFPHKNPQQKCHIQGYPLGCTKKGGFWGFLPPFLGVPPSFGGSTPNFGGKVPF